MKEKLKDITKTDLIFFTIYLLLGIAYMFLNQNYLKLSPTANLIVIWAFIGSAFVYRSVFKKKPKLINKNLMKRATALVLALSVIGVTSFIVPTSNKFVYAYGTNVGEKRIPVSVHFTATQCRTIAERASKVNSWSTFLSILSSAGGKKAGLGGALISLFGYGISNTTSVFLRASNRGTGLTISYTYVIPSYTNIGSAENIRYSYY